MNTNMSNRSRILVGISAMLIAATFAFPLWRVNLVAPQYPEGLGLYISIDDVRGVKEHDIQNINSLNHYIGMKPIQPDSIPELRFMPFVVIALIVFALAATAIGRRWLLFGWLAVFSVVAVAGLLDFYRWEHDYGHNLDPSAAIKIPGMSYQPPLIGSKQLLNITASSWPALGGMAMLVAMLLTLVAAVLEFRRRKIFMAAAVALLLLTGCVHGPRPIAYGEDECAHCQMVIVDRRYGSELISAKGRIHMFDSIECMARFAAINSTEPAQAYVTSFDDPGNLVKAQDALIIHSTKISSPMGGGLAAFTEHTAAALQQKYGGNVFADWNQVVAFVQQQ